MNRTLLIILVLIQGFIAYQAWQTLRYVKAQFAVAYFGVEEAQRLAQYNNIKKEFDKNLQGHGWTPYSVPTITANA